MGGSGLYENTFMALYAQHNDAFQAIVRYVSGFDKQLLFDTSMKGFVTDVLPVKGLSCTLKSDFRWVVSEYLENGRIVVHKKEGGFHATLKPIKRTQDLSHPTDNRTKTQRKRDKGNLEKMRR